MRKSNNVPELKICQQFSSKSQAEFQCAKSVSWGKLHFKFIFLWETLTTNVLYNQYCVKLAQCTTCVLWTLFQAKLCSLIILLNKKNPDLMDI